MAEQTTTRTREELLALKSFYTRACMTAKTDHAKMVFNGRLMQVNAELRNMKDGAR